MKKLIPDAQSRQVFERIQKEGLNLSEFQWIQRETKFGRGYVVSLLFHLPTKHYFLFDYNDDDECYAKFSPGRSAPAESMFTKTWDRQLDAVACWLQVLKSKTI